MALLACNSCGHLANHLDSAPSSSAISFGIANTILQNDFDYFILILTKVYLNHFQDTIRAIICGPLTAELVFKSDGRWIPVFLIAAAVDSVGAVIYYSHSGSNQII